ncbi:RCC1 domain-containing protein [Chitinimonas lacunae]|uniref:RCC1 domain-containing protein n=1 Tax=Chitinimonas lacunae TaxID=1963018 RepID=A0ABV8MLM8_9NEIS
MKRFPDQLLPALLALVLAWPSGHAATPGVAAGWDHSLALDANGTVYAWGSDISGQLGSNRNLAQLLPQRLSLPVPAIAVAGGDHFSLALGRDGTVWAWGDNGYGQLADRQRIPRAAPGKVAGLSAISGIAAGDDHALALKSDGSVWSWGRPQGSDTALAGQSEVKRVEGLSGIRQIAAGADHSLALDASGQVWTWGDNDCGQLGDDGERRTTPQRVYGIYGASGIAAGGRHSLVMFPDGSVWGWGCNDKGQVGDGSGQSKSYATQVFLSGIRSIATRGDWSIAVAGDDVVWVWGSGIGLSPRPFTALRGKQAALGCYHVMTLNADRSVTSIGDNSAGQLGNGSQDYSIEPIRAVGVSNASAITAGCRHAMALLGDGSVQVWGLDDHGQLGLGTVTTSTTPIKVTGLSSVTQTAAANGKSYALRSDGTVWMWGSTPCEVSTSYPMQVPGLSQITAIAPFTGYPEGIAALRQDHTVWVYRRHHDELVGGCFPQPQQITGLNGAVSIAATSSHVLALDSLGQVGYGTYNPLSNNWDAGVVPGFNGAVSLSNSDFTFLALLELLGLDVSYTSYAVKSDGSVWALRQPFGLGYAPTRVPMSEAVRQVAGSPYGAWALTRTGRVFSLDNGDQVEGLSDMSQIAAGFLYLVGNRRDGVVWGVGADDFGQLGDGNYAEAKLASVVYNVNAGTNGNDWFLDLQPGTSKLPTQGIPPFISIASRSGSTSAFNLNAEVRFFRPNPPGSSGAFSAATDPVQVFVAAFSTPDAQFGGGQGFASLDTLFIRDTRGWGRYLGGPLQPYMSGVPPTGSTLVSLLKGERVDQLPSGTAIYLGWGTSADEMLANGRYKVVYTVK